MLLILGLLACAGVEYPELADFDASCDQPEDCVLVEVPESNPCSGCSGSWAALNETDAPAYIDAAEAYEESTRCRGGMAQTGCSCESEGVEPTVACEAGSCEVVGETCI